MDKIFAVYKPKGPTSRQVLNELQKITGEWHIGHAGTLDPLASGVLVVGMGREATKKLNGAVASEKEYIAKIKLGETSTTDDSEGIVKSQITNSKLRMVRQAHHPEQSRRSNHKSQIPNEGQVREVIKTFIGKIQQIPPVYSAVKIKGKEAYKRARKGEQVEMKSREIEIKSIEILEYSYPYLILCVVTGPGVYIRSLARDIGEKLGVGGYLADLERTRVGDFRKEDAVVIEKFGKSLIN